MASHQCFTCGGSFEYTVFGDSTMIKCARCVQAERLQQSARDQADAARRSAEAAENAAREQAWMAQQAASALAAQVASARDAESARARQAEERAAAAERALAAARQAEAARQVEEAEAAERATKCPWCGKQEEHAPHAELVDATATLEGFVPYLAADDAWEDDAWAEAEPQLAAHLAELSDTDWVERSTWPFCSKKCRHDARSAGEEGPDGAPTLVARRAALVTRIEASCVAARVRALRSAEVAAARSARRAERARAAREAIRALNGMERAVTENQAAVNAEEAARQAMAAQVARCAAAEAAVATARAATESWFQRTFGNAAYALTKAEQAAQAAETLLAQERAKVEAARMAKVAAPTAAAVAAARTQAGAAVLTALELERAPAEVRAAVVGCVLGVVCPAGSFDMGSPPDEKGRYEDETLHRVTLTRAYAIGVYPVVQALWEAVQGKNPSKFVGPTRPVEQVSWDDCVAFCAALNARLGLDARTDGLRLPTEAEWEYAARAGTRTRYAGGDDLGAVGWYGDNSGKETHPVGQKRANAWGLYDMSGNVWEWTADVYAEFTAAAATDPMGPGSGPVRVYRGGSWNFTAVYARAAFRGRSAPGSRGGNLGLRLSRTIP